MCRGWRDEPCPRGWDQQEQGSACGHWVSCFSRGCGRISDINNLSKEEFILIQFEDAVHHGEKRGVHHRGGRDSGRSNWSCCTHSQEAEGVQDCAQLETSFS